MAVKNNGHALLQLRTLFKVGAVGALSDGQLLERFVTGRGEPRELAFAALVERHGPLVLRVCRSVLRDEDAAEDAFQATFLALARKAGSLWAQDSLAPWLHQAAYRAAAHDRSATIRRRSHEHAAAARRPESVAAPPHHAHDDDLKNIIHEEIDRLPGRFRVAVVLCDLEGRTHEQAARHLGCAVGTVKSRLARGRKRLRGRLERRGLAPTAALAAASVGGAARAAVPTALAESTVVYAATASAAPTSVAVLTEGVLRSMFLRKVNLATTAVAIVAGLAAGAVALAQSGIGRPKDGAGKPDHLGPPGWTYHILASLDGEPPREVAFVEMSGDKPIRVDVPGALIVFQPKRDGGRDHQTSAERPDQEHRKIVLTSPKAMDVDITQPFVCEIRSLRHVEVRTLEKGYLNEILVREGQAVKKGDLMFKIVPTLNKAKVDADSADVIAPFDGLVGRMREQQGSLINEGDTLTTLSDNSKMSVYFKVPERYYLEYMANRKKHEQEDKIELVLANGDTFPQIGKIGAIEAAFDNANGNIKFRADYPNPDRLLRHGQAGTIKIRRPLRNALVIPQRAAFELLDKRYVWVVGEDDVAHQTPITVKHELDDIFVIDRGLTASDKIVLEGVRQVRDGEKVKYEFRTPEKVMRKPKNHAE
jgi:membrane fusion protein, multidrug efflux system